MTNCTCRYNSAAYSSLGPSQYEVMLAQANRSFDTPGLWHKPSYADANCDIGVNITSLYTEIEQSRLKKLSKQECLDVFAQDFLPGYQAVFLMTNTPMPAGQPFLHVTFGNDRIAFRGKGNTIYGWMCNDEESTCTKEEVSKRISNWSFSSRTWVAPFLRLTVPTRHGFQSFDSARSNLSDLGLPVTADTRRLEQILSRHPYEDDLRAELDNVLIWSDSSWARAIGIKGHGMMCGSRPPSQKFEVDHCISLATNEKCQLFFSPPICLLIICCSITKLACIVSTACDNRAEVLLTVGDAISSFLTRPDSATKKAGLLSKRMVQANLGWRRRRQDNGSAISVLASDEYTPRSLPERRRWGDAVSVSRWASTLTMYAVLFSSICTEGCLAD